MNIMFESSCIILYLNLFNSLNTYNRIVNKKHNNRILKDTVKIVKVIIVKKNSENQQKTNSEK